MIDELHPLRCETCKDITCHLCPLLEESNNKAVKFQILLEREYISKRGCASHSSLNHGFAPIPKRMNSFIVTAKELEKLEEACINDYGEWVDHINEQLFDDIRSRPHINKQDGA